MSIATLKRKTQAKYNNSSVGQKAFSLNGTHRSQGYVGQTSISRSLPRTLMNGPTPRGYGSCCGNYYTGHIIQSAVTSLNDPTVVKGSVISTKGMIEEKLQCMSNIQEPYFTFGNVSQYTIVKPDTNKNLNRQSDYIISLAKKAIKIADLSCNIHHDISLNNCNKNCANSDSSFVRGPSYITYTKAKREYAPISQSELIKNKITECTTNDKKFPNPILRSPFGCGLRI